MEFNETIQETAKREVFEETGLTLGEVSLFGIYSGPDREKQFSNGYKAALLEVFFTCRYYTGDLAEQNEESLQNRFFPLKDLPEDSYLDHKKVIEDLLSKKEIPVIR